MRPATLLHTPGMMNEQHGMTSVGRSLSGSRSALGRLGYTLLFGAAALALAACDGGTGGGNAGSAGTAGASGSSAGGSAGDAGAGGTGGSMNIGNVHKVDILLSVDNSRSMADKQQILSLALDDLLYGLANPPCLDASGQVVQAVSGQCPSGAARQYEPVNDIHIGIVSSSLGGHGSDACSTSGAGKQSNDDHGHLLSRTDPAGGGSVPTYQGFGFLSWDPLQQQSPPGESDAALLGQHFKDMVLGVGQVGCGYESQLESVYRFLVDPAPYDTITLGPGGDVQTNGLDQALLDQRKAFLRPDSALLILSLSDENDCSIRESGQYFYAAQQKSGNGSPFHMPAARAICATSPNDPCCASCGQAPPVGCAVDPTCTDANGGLKTLDELSDNINLRCFDQKRRFGIDFLYPVDRYVEGFTSSTITDRSGQVVANPIFSDLDPANGAQQVRDPGLVFFAGIVGVPWQSVAKNPSDLNQGFKNAEEMSQADANGKTTWDKILGNPALYITPMDPYMVESSVPRAGISPGNPINGSEYTISKQDDLEYACIMPLPTPRDCGAGGLASCDCEDPINDSPLCEEGPNGSNTLQTKAKAYPGLRQLGLLKGLGEQGVVGSICAGQIDNPSTPDYAYRPVVASLLDRVKDRLK